MTRDPGEGVGDDGLITTGVADGRIHSPYDEILQVAARRLRAQVGDDLHSLYVYGSVATGQARPPASDLDLYAITRRDVAAACRNVADTLTDRFAPSLREVGISSVVLDEVLADTVEGHAERCFVRHYCRPVAGRDLRPDLPACRASPELARGFNGNVGDVIDRIVHRLQPDELDEAATRRAIAGGSRKLLMTAATLLSARRGTWTTDRGEGARLVASAAPKLAGAVARVERWTALETNAQETPTVDDVIASFVALRDWLVRELGTIPPEGR